MRIEVLWEGRRLDPIAGKLCPTRHSRDSACDVGGKQPVSGGLVGPADVPHHRGQGSESTSEGCRQCHVCL